MAGRRVRITAQSCQGRPCRSQWTYETIASSTTSAAGKVPVQTSPERIATQRARTTAPAVRYLGNYLVREKRWTASRSSRLFSAATSASPDSSAPATQWFTCSSRILNATVSRAVVAAAICVRMSMQ